MPLPGPTEKKKHWQEVVFTPLVSNPGTFQNPCITVNEYGLITSVMECSTASFYVVDEPANLASIPLPSPGDIAIVRDESAGGDPDEPEALYVFDADGAHSGWRKLASTQDLERHVDYRQGSFGIASVTAIGTPVQVASIVKRVSVTITTPYTVGATVDIRDSGGTIYAPNSAINAQVAGTYVVEIPDNATPVTGSALQALVGGGPAAGAGFAFVEYVLA